MDWDAYRISLCYDISRIPNMHVCMYVYMHILIGLYFLSK